uniref:Uncharacterized protein n=1 Tax=Rhizophora mucronata TaxID=61149 RepID=A0A2P2IVY3_RHIMU
MIIDLLEGFICYQNYTMVFLEHICSTFSMINCVGLRICLIASKFSPSCLFSIQKSERRVVPFLGKQG